MKKMGVFMQPSTNSSRQATGREGGHSSYDLIRAGQPTTKRRAVELPRSVSSGKMRAELVDERQARMYEDDYQVTLF